MSTAFHDHLLTGDHASRPVASAVPSGTLYSCTDHDLVYQSDGSAWTTWATLGGSAFREVAAYRTATQSIPTATWTDVSFTATDLVDADGVHDPGSNPERLTMPAAWDGRRIMLLAAIEFAATIGGVRGVRIVKGVTPTRHGEIFQAAPPGAGDPARYQVHSSRPQTVATGDYFRVQVYQNTGGNLNIQSTAESTLIFTAYTVD